MNNSRSSSTSSTTSVALVPTNTSNTTSNNYGYDESCDLWSLGVILYTMLSGEVPFNSITCHRTPEEIVEDITKSKLSYNTSAWKNVSQSAKELVQGKEKLLSFSIKLNVQRNVRLTQILFSGLLTVDPSKRLTIKDLSRNSWLRGSSISSTQESQQLLMTPNILCQASRSLIVRAVNVTMRAFQKAGQFQLSSVMDGVLARRRFTKRSTDSCSSTSSSTTVSSSAVVPSRIVSSISTLPHTRRLCGNGVCRCRHAMYPNLDTQAKSSFDFSDERLSQLIDQYPLTNSNSSKIQPKRYGMTLRSRTTGVSNVVQHEFASPAPPPPPPSLINLPLLSSPPSNDHSSSILFNVQGEKRTLTSPMNHSFSSANKKVKRSGTITIDD